MADRVITIGENDNLYDKCREAGISTDKYYRQLKVITAKIANNKTGYAQFKSDNEWIKIIVLPKTIENSKDFILYFNEYYRLLNKYDSFNSRFELKSISDYQTMSNKALSIDSEEHLIVEKYNHTLNNILHYFKSHKLSHIENEEYISQDIKYALDIRKNIVSIDKSLIKQKKPSKKPWSEQAEIAYGAIKLFLKTKRDFLMDNEELWQTALKVSKMIKAAYPDNDGHTFNPLKMTKLGKSKVFKKRKDRKLFADICVLLGENLISNGEKISKYIKLDDTIAVFWEPDKMYEIYVYDIVIEYLRKNNITFKAIYQDDSKIYSLYQKEGKSSIKKSIPDIYITYKTAPFEKDKGVVFDAKWKILNTPEAVNYSDIVKLERDCNLRNSNTGVLIYPKTFIQSNHEWFLATGNKADFGFFIMEYGFDFTDENKMLNYWSHQLGTIFL